MSAWKQNADVKEGLFFFIFYLIVGSEAAEPLGIGFNFN